VAVFLALSVSAKVTMVVIAAILVFAFVHWAVATNAAYRRRQEKDIIADARESDRNVLAGIRTLAEIYDYLIEHPTALSRQGVDFTDAHAQAMDSFHRTLESATNMSRDRRLRHLMRELRKLFGQEETFRRFRNQVLREVLAQMRAGTVSAPLKIEGAKQASFTVLSHNLPSKFWSLMEAALAEGVTLRVKDVDGVWHRVKLDFMTGGKAVFHVRHLNRAVELELGIGRPGRDQSLFEFEVDHEIPLRRADGTIHRPSVTRAELAALEAEGHDEQGESEDPGG